MKDFAPSLIAPAYEIAATKDRTVTLRYIVGEQFPGGIAKYVVWSKWGGTLCLPQTHSPRNAWRMFCAQAATAPEGMHGMTLLTGIRKPIGQPMNGRRLVYCMDFDMYTDYPSSPWFEIHDDNGGIHDRWYTGATHEAYQHFINLTMPAKGNQ